VERTSAHVHVGVATRCSRGEDHSVQDVRQYGIQPGFVHANNESNVEVVLSAWGIHQYFGIEWDVLRGKGNAMARCELLLELWIVVGTKNTAADHG
jgi:hypothetical protein